MSMLKMSETEKNNIWEKVFTEKAGFILVVVGFVIIIGAIIAFACFRSWSFSSTINEEIVGQFGDFMGGVVGTLFALVGVVLYYVALAEQRNISEKIKEINELTAQMRAITREHNEYLRQLGLPELEA